MKTLEENVLSTGKSSRKGTQRKKKRQEIGSKLEKKGRGPLRLKGRGSSSSSEREGGFRLNERGGTPTG